MGELIGVMLSSTSPPPLRILARDGGLGAVVDGELDHEPLALQRELVHEGRGDRGGRGGWDRASGPEFP